MNQTRQFRNRAVLPGLALVALASAGAASASPKLPKDPCALLKPAEIQAALAPKATIGPGVPATDMAPVGVSCSYTWGPRTPQWGQSSVTVTVLDLSQAYPGVSGDQLKEGVMAEAMARDATITASRSPASVTRECSSSNPGLSMPRARRSSSRRGSTCRFNSTEGMRARKRRSSRCCGRREAGCSGGRIACPRSRSTSDAQVAAAHARAEYGVPHRSRCARCGCHNQMSAVASAHCVSVSGDHRRAFWALSRHQ